jgi:polar amino acid transport system substrate-binding protein
MAALGSIDVRNVQQMADPRVADLVLAGKIRFGVFPPQYTKDPGTGDLKGPWVEVMRALAAHAGVDAMLIELANPEQLVQHLASGACDVGSLGFDPSRAAQVGGFTAPFMRVDYTYLVPRDSSLHRNDDVDDADVRIAAVRDHASTLALGRILKRARQVSADTPDAAFELLRSGHADVWASIRPALLDYAPKLAGSRVLEDSYGANLPALVVAKGKAAWLAYISEFIERAKATGLARRAIESAGQPGFQAVV